MLYNIHRFTKFDKTASTRNELHQPSIYRFYIGLGCGMLNVHTSAVMVSRAIALSPENHSETRQPAFNAVHFGNSNKVETTYRCEV